MSPDEPILRYVDLSTTHISQAQRLTTPDWARTVIPGPKGAPLLYAGLRAGLPTAVLAFEPRRSDLPLQVAFPILLSNLTGELLGGSAAPTEPVAPGTPVSLTIPSGCDRRHGHASGRHRPPSCVANATGGASVSYVATDLPGIYTVTPIRAADRVAEPVGERRVESEPDAALERPAIRRAVRVARGTRVPVDPNAPVHFAVDLFDVANRPSRRGPWRRIEGLGAAPDRRAAPGDGTPTDRPTTRDELWLPIVLLVLVGLCVEWARLPS